MDLTRHFADYGRLNPVPPEPTRYASPFSPEPPAHLVEGPVTVEMFPEMRTYNRAAFADKLAALWETGVRAFIVDCHETVYIDAASTGMLKKLARQIREAGGSFVLVRLSDEMAELYRVTKIDTVVDVCPSAVERRRGA